MHIHDSQCKWHQNPRPIISLKPMGCNPIGFRQLHVKWIFILRNIFIFFHDFKYKYYLLKVKFVDLWTIKPHGLRFTSVWHPWLPDKHPHHTGSDFLLPLLVQHEHPTPQPPCLLSPDCCDTDDLSHKDTPLPCYSPSALSLLLARWWTKGEFLKVGIKYSKLHSLQWG